MKKLGLVTFILLLAVIAFALWQLVVKPKPNVLIDVAPDSAVLTLDGNKIHSKSINVTPGEHTIKADLPGFTEASHSFTVNNSGVTHVALLLNPNSQAGYDYLQKHPDQERHREALGGQKFGATGEALTKSSPLVKDLPFIDQFYRIDYGPSEKHSSDPSAIAIYITYYSDSGKQQALQWLAFKGFDPSKLEIIYQPG